MVRGGPAMASDAAGALEAGRAGAARRRGGLGSVGGVEEKGARLGEPGALRDEDMVELRDAALRGPGGWRAACCAPARWLPLRLRAALWRRPLLGWLGRSGLVPFEAARLRLWEMLAVALLAGCVLWVFARSAPRLWVGGCVAKGGKAEDCAVLSYRVKKFGQHVGGAGQWLVALALVPVSRGSLLLAATGLSFDKTAKWHRWLGRLVGLVTLVHAFGFTVSWTAAGLFWSKMNSSENLAGAVAAVLVGWIQLTSLDWVRRSAYRVFYLLHAALGPALIVSLLYHHEGEDFRGYIALPLLLLALDKLWRLGAALVAGRWRVQAVREVGPDIVKLQLERAGRAPEAAAADGAWVYLQLPVVSKTELHPYSVCNARFEPAEGQADRLREYEGARMVVYVKQSRAPGAWSTRLLQTVHRSRSLLAGAPIWVDGPYGGLELPFPLRAYDGAVIAAGGIGITPLLPLLLRLTGAEEAAGGDSNKTDARAPAPFLEFVWSTRDVELVFEFAESLRSAARSANARVHVFVTGPPQGKGAEAAAAAGPEAHRKDLKHCLGPQVELVIGDRPDLFEFVNSAIDNAIARAGSSRIAGSRVLVAGLVCGPQQLVEDLFVEVALAEAEAKGSVLAHLHAETFHI